jgi:hypothetical protein
VWLREWRLPPQPSAALAPGGTVFCFDGGGKMVSRTLKNLPPIFRSCGHKSMLSFFKSLVPQEGFEPHTPSLRMILSASGREPLSGPENLECSEKSYVKQVPNSGDVPPGTMRYQGFLTILEPIWNLGGGHALALQLLFLRASESMGNHDSKVVDADSVD